MGRELSKKEIDRYTPILMRAHGLIESDRNLKFGEALRLSIHDAGVTVPKDVEDAMLVSLAKVVFNGFPSDIEA